MAAKKPWDPPSLKPLLTSSVVFSPPPLLIPMHLKRDDVELRLFTTITTVGTPQDITVQELRIESFLPADEASEAMIRKIGAN